MTTSTSSTNRPEFARFGLVAFVLALVASLAGTQGGAGGYAEGSATLEPLAVGSAAPVRQFPICEELVNPNAFQCPNNFGPASAMATGALSGNGVVQVRITPLVPACDSYDPGSKTWTPSPCYSGVRFSNIAACFYFNDNRQRLDPCVEPEFRDGTAAGSTSDDRMDLSQTRLGNNGEMVEARKCGATADFGRFVFGGALPDNTWADVAPTVLECTVNLDRTPDNLWGATWHRWSMGIIVEETGDPEGLRGGNAEVFYRVEGTIGPNAPVPINPDPDPDPRPEPVGPFTDVSSTSFARDDIELMFDLGITNGTSATTYGPALSVSREQMASFLARTWRALGQTCASGPSPFSDVPATSFAFADTTCIAELGVTTGVGGGRYAPAGLVTREQMASFLARIWRALGNDCPTPVTGFVDVAASSFARTDIGCIFGLGITNGTSPTTYGPAQPVTREQMAAFLGRLYRAATA